MSHLSVATLACVVLLAAGAGASAQPDPNVAAKLAALEKLCAAGLLTPQDCAQRRATLTGAPGPAPPAAMQDQTFHDPQGRYTARVPEGWKMAADNGVATFSAGESWATLIPSPASQPDQGASDVINQMGAQYRTLKQANGGRMNIDGRPGVYATFQGVNGKGQSVAITAFGIQAPANHVLVFVSSSPADQLNAVSPKFLEILNSIHFAGE